MEIMLRAVWKGLGTEGWKRADLPLRVLNFLLGKQRNGQGGEKSAERGLGLGVPIPCLVWVLVVPSVLAQRGHAALTEKHSAVPNPWVCSSGMACFGGLSCLGKEQEGISAETQFPSVLGLRCCLKTKWVVSRYFKYK